MGFVVCLSTCWACKFGECPKDWHSWVDQLELHHMKSQGKLADPDCFPCNCSCMEGKTK